MATSSDKAETPPGGGAAADAGADAVVAPVQQLTPEGEPDVLSERGKSVIRLDDWTTSAFNYTFGEGDDARPVIVTADGLRVTKAEATELHEAAARHGVRTVIEEAAK